MMATIAELIDKELLEKLEKLKAELERVESDGKEKEISTTNGRQLLHRQPRRQSVSSDFGTSQV